MDLFKKTIIQVSEYTWFSIVLWSHFAPKSLIFHTNFDQVSNMCILRHFGVWYAVYICIFKISDEFPTFWALSKISDPKQRRLWSILKDSWKWKFVLTLLNFRISINQEVTIHQSQVYHPLNKIYRLPIPIFHIQLEHHKKFWE